MSWRVRDRGIITVVKMVLDGKVVATTTGKDVERMKRELYRCYFRLPEDRPQRQRRRRG